MVEEFKRLFAWVQVGVEKEMAKLSFQDTSIVDIDESKKKDDRTRRSRALQVLSFPRQRRIRLCLRWESNGWLRSTPALERLRASRRGC